MDTQYLIPRDLRAKEGIAYGLTGKQILYIGAGLMAGLGAVGLPIPIDLKIVTGVVSTTSGVIFSLARRHGQELDRYLLNSVRYQVRNKEWGVSYEKDEIPIKIRFHSREASAV